MPQSPNKPIKVFRLKGVKTSVFENKSQDSVFHKVTIQKIYKDGDEWKTTSSLFLLSRLFPWMELSTL
jgi:hypothetical protein